MEVKKLAEIGSLKLAEIGSLKLAEIGSLKLAEIGVLTQRKRHDTLRPQEIDDLKKRRDKMARQQKVIIPSDFPTVYPEGWGEYIERKFTEIYNKAEVEKFEVYELCYATTGERAPFRLIIGKFGPVWQSEQNRGVFVSFEDETSALAKGFVTKVVEKRVSIELVSTKDEKLSYKIKRIS